MADGNGYDPNGDGNLVSDFVEQWRDPAYGCFSSGHKFCREVCPVTQVTRNENHTPTAFHANIVAMEKGLIGVEDVADDYVHCTQCGACELRCPNTLMAGDFYRVRTRTVDVVKAMRALMVATGNEREQWKLWNERLAERHNEPVLGEIPVSQEHVADWAGGLDIPVGGETILFVDCEAAFARTSYSRAFAQLLQKAGYEFGLMREQWCCGGPAAEMGYLDLARRHAEHNVADWRAVGARRIIAPDPHDYIAFTEDYPKIFGDGYDFEIVLGVELVNELVKEGRIALTQPVERVVTYHDPCRLNKRKGVHEAPRELLRAVPGITLKDVDHVTQWSYCSGGGGGLPIEKPEIAEEISRRRVGPRAGTRGRRADQRLPVVGAAAVGGRRRSSGTARGARLVRARRAVGRDRGRRSHARAPGGAGMSVAIKSAIDDAVVDELRAIFGHDDGRVLPNLSSRVNRTRVPAPFPVHRWADHMPDLAVLPRTAHEVSEVVKLANRRGIPIVPRAGGTGLSDGAVPLRGGILVDCKLMNLIHEIDLVDRTVTVGPGINMLKLNEELRPHGVFYPDDPASYPCSLVGGRIGTGGWSLLGARFGHTRDLVISMEVVLPTGEIVEIGEGGGRKLRKSSTGLTLKQLFTGHQGTLGITTQATLELFPRPEVEFAAFFAFEDYMSAWETTGVLTRSGLATLAGVVLFDEWKIDYLRRDDEAYIPQPESVKAVVAVAMYGRRCEVEPASKEIMRLGRCAAAATSGTRSPRATGPPVTTATRSRCTAGARTARRC